MAEIAVIGLRDGEPHAINATINDAEIAARAVAATAARAARVPSLSGMVFLARLTDAEYASILQAAQSELTAGNPQLSRWIDMLRVNGTINVNDETAQAAKAFVVAGGLITADRANVIFSA